MRMEEEEKKKMAGSQFFRIMSDHIIEDRRLGLPKEFGNLFGEELGKSGVIEDPAGKIWPVELRKAKGEIYFQSGWQEIMEYFSISVGDYLFFRYIGDSHFHISIGDKTACEIDYPCQTTDFDESHSERVSEREKDNPTEDVPFQCATRTAHIVDRAGPNCVASKRNRYEDNQNDGGSVKRNKSDGFEEITCEPWTFDYTPHPEVPTISPNCQSNDKDYQNPGDSDNHVTDNIQENRCRPQAINMEREPEVVRINLVSDEHHMPTNHISVNHNGKFKIPKKVSFANLNWLSRNVDFKEQIVLSEKLKLLGYPFLMAHQFAFP